MDDQTMNYVVGIIVLVALGVGGLSMLFGKIVDAWDVLSAWWGHGVQKAIHYRPVNTYSDDAADNMSSDGGDSASSAASSPRTDDRTDGRTEAPPRIRAEELLTVYQLMRAYGIKRDEAAAAFKASGLPLSNDVWRRAEPPPKAAQDDDDVLITPYAGRRTRASYYPEEPELEYKSPA